MYPTALLVHVQDWEVGFAWYKKAFPEAKTIEMPEINYRVLQIGEFLIEVVYSDEKVPSGRAGTVLYWKVDDLLKEIEHFKKLGSELYRGPMSIENGLGMCQVTDPFGNLIGLRGPFNNGSMNLPVQESGSGDKFIQSVKS